jgi:hypothetical protein
MTGASLLSLTFRSAGLRHRTMPNIMIVQRTMMVRSAKPDELQRDQRTGGSVRLHVQLKPYRPGRVDDGYPASGARNR